MTLLRAAGAAYLLGAIPFSFLLARLRGIDLRAIGSGNPGATNVARALGWRLGLLALALDIGKGAGAVAIGRAHGLEGYPLAVVGAAGVLGHVFSVFLAFRGGKGVATAAGAFLALEPAAMAAGLATFGVSVGATRYVSLGSLLGVTALVASVVWLRGPTHPNAVLAYFAWAMLVLRHRANIARLLAGTENRLGTPPPASP